jgi:hypothetical protein
MVWNADECTGGDDDDIEVGAGVAIGMSGG